MDTDSHLQWIPSFLSTQNPNTSGAAAPASASCAARPAHPEQRIEGNGKKYFLHLLSPEELQARGMSHKKAQLVIETYQVVVLSNEWLEELFCPQCGSSRWCHIAKIDRVVHSVRWAPRELWEQVAHVDPLVPNPSVSQFTRRSARRTDGRRLYDPR